MKYFWVLLILSFSTLTYAAAETTEFRKIATIQMGATGSVYFVADPAGWGAPSCPNAIYAHYNKASNSAAAEFLSLALAAKAAGYTVGFNGVCSADGNYIKVNYIKVR